MNIYLLSANHVNYDMVEGFVIRASSMKEAREIASKHPGDEGALTWLTPSLSTCNLIGKGIEKEEPEMILRAFNAG